MATLTATDNLTLQEAVRRFGGGAGELNTVELLAQDNPILKDIVYKQANSGITERVLVRTNLPPASWTVPYEGVKPKASGTATLEFGVGHLTSRSVLDLTVAGVATNPVRSRMLEDAAHIQSMQQEFVSKLFYGNDMGQPQSIKGFSPRYNALSNNNVISAGGSASTGGDLTSIWLIAWSDSSAYCIFPVGSSGGLSQRDLNMQQMTTADGRNYDAYVTVFDWKVGLAIADWRSVVRICNIDLSDLAAGTGTQAKDQATVLIKLLSDAESKIPDSIKNRSRLAFYANGKVFAGIRRQALDFSQNALDIQKSAGQFQAGRSMFELSFFGIPIRLTDGLIAAEATVS